MAILLRRSQAFLLHLRPRLHHQYHHQPHHHHLGGRVLRRGMSVHTGSPTPGILVIGCGAGGGSAAGAGGSADGGGGAGGGTGGGSGGGGAAEMPGTETGGQSRYRRGLEASEYYHRGTNSQQVHGIVEPGC
eukprot:885340-Prorocentrum_minimum.AAC.1